MRKLGAGGLVYSTDAGRMCPVCRAAVADCHCSAPSRPAGNSVARVSRETKGRGGKVVTLVRGIDADEALLAALAKRIKTACGSGGTVKDGVVEIQGEHCERVLVFLKQEGFNAKRAGG
jgi:translation initiation factor 1